MLQNIPLVQIQLLLAISFLLPAKTEEHSMRERGFFVMGKGGLRRAEHR